MMAAGLLIAVPRDRLAAVPQPLRRAAGRHPRRRGADPLPRLRPRQHQAGGLRGGRHHGEHRRGRCSPRSPASSRPRTSADGVDHDDRRRRPGWPHVAARPGPGRDRRRVRAVRRSRRTSRTSGPTSRAGCSSWSCCSSRSASPRSGRSSRRWSAAVTAPERRPARAGGGRADPVLPRRGLPRGPRPDRRLRRLQGHPGRRRHLPAGAAALPHRPERRRQDHPGRRPHRAVARHRLGASSAATNLLTMKSHKIVRLGIGRTFQTATVFEQLSVLQNLDIAAGLHRKALGLLLPRRKVPESVEQALETIGLTALAHRPAGILAHGQKQWLEVGMLLVQDAKVMFLDETVAGMSAEEREETGELLQADRRRPDHRRHRARHGLHAQLRRLRDGHARRQGARRGDGRRDPGRPEGSRGLPGDHGRRWRTHG